MSAPRGIRFIAASGRDFSNDSGMWQELLSALQRTSVRWLFLSGCRLSDEQVSVLLVCVASHATLETVLIGALLWRRLVDERKIAEESRFVPSLVLDDVPFSSEAVRQRTLTRVARLHAASLLLSASHTAS